MPLHWLLAAIESVEPTAWPLLGIMAVSVAMYAVGILLPGCKCCGVCSLCTEGTLPGTVTLSIDGFSAGSSEGPDITSISFSSDFGGGAEARVTAPGGNADDDKGPISAVVMLSGGEGYARIARVEPTVTASRSGGSGASLSVTQSQIEYDGRPAWEVTGVTVTSGGTGYTDGSLAFNAGTGATTQSSADGFAYTGRSEPTVSASVASEAGAGAGLSVSLSSSTGYDGRQFWYVASLSIDDAGAGYAENDVITATATDGQSGPYFYFYAFVSSVDETGAITGITLYGGGAFYKSTGVIESIDLYSGGIYYKDDPSLPGETADVTISVVQFGPTASTASGAVLDAVIDDDTSSDTFGEITGITITDGGENYLAWEYCEAYLNGITEVLAKTGDCSWGYQSCGRSFSVEYLGPDVPSLVTLSSNGCSFTLEADDLISDCSSLSFTASDEDGRSVSVSPGGDPSGLTCSDCIGTVTVAGQEVTINGPYTLVCVATHIDRPASPTGTYPIQMLSWAKASAYCHAESMGKTEIWVDVQIGAIGIVSFPFPQVDYDEAYDGLELGAERNVDGNFAPYNFSLSTVTRVLSLGPVRGMNCVGGGPTELDIGFFSNASLFPCASEMNAATREDIVVAIQCNTDE